ncbi:glycosyltransferase family 8 protein [Lactiplantibacillus plantarum]|uniref:glycosyltransferase family 8 protein n=1 Tax=Lactiplantibacillus plantarum TaxID=1590 RepID=UPI000977E056|nr:glycosyltransferase family 8 protein [Lactiplantibacillus plantarum]MCK8475399.1 glycosyltransferase family 8 protein [Lactiplantibacillus plantarum]RDD75135.1 glycosyltransferase family 8 protein [Lactiplantibacillus plantarum]
MNIVYTINCDFFSQLCVSILSVLKHTSQKLNFFVISSDIQQQQFSYLKEIVRKAACDRDISVKLFSPLIAVKSELKADRGDISQYYRLFLVDIFKNNGVDVNKLQRVVFLDADTLIVGDHFEDLSKINLNNNVIGACLDPWSKLYRPVFNLDRKVYMINSGVLVIDLNKWLENRISERINSIIMNRKGFFPQGDQGILDEAFKGKFEILPLSYNLNSLSVEFSYHDLCIYRKPQSYYSKLSYDQAKMYPTIVHFTSSFLCDRPWIYDITSDYGQIWRQSKEKLQLPKTNYKNKSVIVFLYKTFKPIKALNFLGIVQAYVRPLMWLIQRRRILR